jgi:predicted nucleic acid-binding protein
MGRANKKSFRPQLLNVYLIDTDIIIWVLRGNKRYEELLQNLKDKDTLSISTVTIAEIYENIFPSEIVKTENVLDELQTWDVTPEIAKQAGLYWQEYTKELKKLSLIDCFIASTANINNLTLVTLNTKHFPMRDINILNPPK